MNWTKCATISAAAALAALGVLTVGCGSTETEDKAPIDLDGLPGVTQAELGTVVTSCTAAATTGTPDWDNATKSWTLTLPAGTTIVAVDKVTSAFKVNGNTCKTDTGTTLTTSLVKKININGTAGVETLILDFLTGSFGPQVLSNAGGIKVDLLGGTDTFILRGTTSADKFRFGTDGTAIYGELTGGTDTVLDLRVVNGENFTVSMGSGNDTFSGEGGSLVGSHLAGGTLTTISAVPTTQPFTILGGDGNDTIYGGLGNDIVWGGAGDDVFKATTASTTTDGNDTFYGDSGTDTVDYSIRTVTTTVTIGGTVITSTASANDGMTGETDDIKYTVENITSGSGNDTLTGSGYGVAVNPDGTTSTQVGSNIIIGGAGDDIINGGADTSGGTCTSSTDYDSLQGGDGDDIFLQNATMDCPDLIDGGNGTDTVSYSSRTSSVTVKLDDLVNDGESGETDNIKSTVENVWGGSGADTIEGSASANVLHGCGGGDTISGKAGDDTLIGNSGNDTLTGGDGNDTFDEGAADLTVTGNCTTSSELQKGAGADTLVEATTTLSGFDTVTYSGRSVTTSISNDDVANDGASNEGDNIASAIEHIVGGDQADTITGGANDDLIEGGLGADTIHGGAGNDVIYGEGGSNSVYGDAGDDTLDNATGTMDGGSGDDICSGAATKTTCEM